MLHITCTEVAYQEETGGPLYVLKGKQYHAPGLALPVKAARASMLRQMLDNVLGAARLFLCVIGRLALDVDTVVCLLLPATREYALTRPCLRSKQSLATLEPCWCLSARQWSLSRCWVAQRCCLCLQAAGGCYHGCSAPPAPHRCATCWLRCTEQSQRCQ